MTEVVTGQIIHQGPDSFVLLRKSGFMFPASGAGWRLLWLMLSCRSSQSSCQKQPESRSTLSTSPIPCKSPLCCEWHKQSCYVVSIPPWDYPYGSATPRCQVKLAQSSWNGGQDLAQVWGSLRNRTPISWHQILCSNHMLLKGHEMDLNIKPIIVPLSVSYYPSMRIIHFRCHPHIYVTNKLFLYFAHNHKTSNSFINDKLVFLLFPGIFSEQQTAHRHALLESWEIHNIAAIC